MTAQITAGQIFKKARVNKGLTQIEVAKRAGIYPNTYSKIERGEQKPQYSTIKKLAVVLAVDLSDIPA